MFTDEVKIFFDGSCDNSKKDNRMGVGIAVYWNGEELEEYNFSGLVGYNGTSNAAEWSGLILSIGILRDLVNKEKVDLLKTKLSIFSDSQLIVNQANGVFEVRNEKLKMYKDLYDSICLSNLHLHYKLCWIPREKNTRADELSKVKTLLKKHQG